MCIRDRYINGVYQNKSTYSIAADLVTLTFGSGNAPPNSSTIEVISFKTITSTDGTFTATTFLGDLNGTINTATTATTQSAGNNSTKVATTAYADAKVADAINNGTTAIAPSQNVVFDALALKANLAGPTFTGTLAGATATFTSNITGSRLFSGDGGNKTNPMIANGSDQDTGIFFPAANTMAFSAGDTESFRIAGANTTFAGNVKVGSSATVTPATQADDIVIDKGASESGITIVSTAAASLRFGDAASASVGYIEYNHSSNAFSFGTNGSTNFTITSGGNVTVANDIILPQDGVVAFNSTSDEYITASADTLFLGTGDSVSYTHLTLPTTPYV